MAGYTKQEQSKRYTPQDGDTLEAIARRETEAGNPITAADIARYNWGTDDPEVVNEMLRDELGCYRRDEAKNFMISQDASGEGELRIPQRFSQRGLALETTHEVRVQKKAPPPPQLQACVTIPGVTFGYDMSFIRPSVVGYLQELEKKVAEYPEAKLIVFGHTDKVGSEAYNKSLSERRAESVYAFITNDTATWERLYQEEDWGEPVLSEILADIGSYYDPEEAGSFEEAVYRFQVSRVLEGNGKADKATRKLLFQEYMMGKHDVELTPSQFIDPKFMGCGEFNPVIDVAGSAELNRRVVFYLLHEQRTPNIPCALGDLSPCRKQIVDEDPRKTATFRCSFYDSIASTCESGGVTPAPPQPATLKIKVVFQDEAKESATVTITGSTRSRTAHTNAQGIAVFEDVEPGGYEVEAVLDTPKHDLVEEARGYIGSKLWAHEKRRDPLPPKTVKCNLFVYEMANNVGYTVPGDYWQGYLPDAEPYPPLSEEWADPDTEIGDWKSVKEPKPGDMIAEAHEYADATGHVGIISYPRGGVSKTLDPGEEVLEVVHLSPLTISQSSIPSVNQVVENDWGWRPDNSPTFKRYKP